MISLALLLGSKSICVALKRVIVIAEGSLFRSSWYLAREPFNINDKPLIEVGTEAYTDLINRMNSQKHIKKLSLYLKMVNLDVNMTV